MKLTFDVELNGCCGQIAPEYDIYLSHVREFRNQLLTGGLTGFDSFRIVAGSMLSGLNKTYFRVIKRAQIKHATYTARINDKVTALITRNGGVRFLDGNTGDPLPDNQYDAIVKPFDGLDIASSDLDTYSFNKFRYNLRRVFGLFSAMRMYCCSDIALPQYIQVSDTQCVDLAEIIKVYQEHIDWQRGRQIVTFDVGVYPWGNDEE